MSFSEEGTSREQLLAYAKKAEELGFSSLSANDHIVFHTDWLDCLGALSSAASVTNKIRIGTSTLNIVVRNPIICAKALSTLDILSSGRLFAGVSPGSFRGDYDVCGVPFEERWARFSEALEVLRSIWNSPTVEFFGKFYRRDKMFSLGPKPYQKPHPPIFVGSWGSEAGLKRVARYSDGWMASAYNITPEEFKQKWKLLLAIRKALGKEVETFENSVMTMFGYVSANREKARKVAKEVLSPSLGRPAEMLQKLLLFDTPNECARKLQSFADAGAQLIHFWPVSDYLDQIELFSKEIVPQLD